MANGPYYSKGEYWARIKSQAMGETKNENPQLILGIEIMGQIDPKDRNGELISCECLDRTMYLVITENTVDFVTDNLRALGFEGNSFALLDPSTEGYHDFVGTEFAAFCQHSTYEGKVSEKWSVGGQREAKPLEVTKLRKLDSMFGSHLKRKPVTKKPATAQQAAKTLAGDPNAELQAAGDAAPF